MKEQSISLSVVFDRCTYKKYINVDTERLNRYQKKQEEDEEIFTFLRAKLSSTKKNIWTMNLKVL